MLRARGEALGGDLARRWQHHIKPWLRIQALLAIAGAGASMLGAAALAADHFAPPLPPLPGIPASSAVPNAPQVPTPGAPQAPAPLAPLSVGDAPLKAPAEPAKPVAAPVAAAGDPNANPLAAAPPIAPETAGDKAPILAPPPLPFTPLASDAPPDLPLPAPASLSAMNSVKQTSSPGLPLLNQPLSQDIFDLAFKKKEPKLKSWQTKLVSTISPLPKPVKIVHYTLPASLYRAQYTADNQHLPRLRTREEYAGLLIERAEANDLDAVRALLAAGAPMNYVNAAGETARAAAQRSGATETAMLLSLRGAK